MSEEDKQDRDFKGGPGEGQEGKGGCRCRPTCKCGEETEEFDHLDYTAGLWKGAFHEALHKERVEALRAKIRTLMGKSMEETADVVVTAMVDEWKRDMQREAEKEAEAAAPKADEALKERIKEAWKKGPQ